MSKTARVVHTPGEQPTSALQPVGEQPADQAGEQQTGDGDQQESGDDELARLRAENAALKDEVAARKARDAQIAASDTAAMSEKLTSNKPAAGLRAIDVDPTKIKRAVLTMDGWVCPAEAPQYNAKR